jgi:hypothetical protein
MFYKTTQRPTALGIRLSPKNPDKKFFPKWHIEGQGEDVVSITENIPENTIGFFLGFGEARYGGMNITSVPCVMLLIGERVLYVPEQCVRLVSDEEIRNVVDNNEQKQKT